MKSYLFVSSVEIYKFKAKHSEINTTSLCLGNVYENTGLYGYVLDFSVDYESIDDVDDIFNDYDYLMKKHDIKFLN